MCTVHTVVELRRDGRESSALLDPRRNADADADVVADADAPAASDDGRLLRL